VSEGSGIGRSIDQKADGEAEDVDSCGAFKECGELSEALATNYFEEGIRGSNLARDATVSSVRRAKSSSIVVVLGCEAGGRLGSLQVK